MKIFSFLLFLVATAAGAQTPYQPQMQAAPGIPNSQQPFRLNFQTWCMVHDAAPNPILERREKVLTVRVNTAGCILIYPPPADLPFHVDVPALPAGAYTVELRPHDEDPEADPLASFSLAIQPAPTRDPQPSDRQHSSPSSAVLGEFPPFLPQMQVEPVQPTALQPFRLNFQTWCTVSSTANPVLERQGMLLTVRADPGGCVTSYPPPEDDPFHVDVDSLEAGNYTVHLRIRGQSAGLPPEGTFPLVVAPPYTGEFAPQLRVEPANPNSLQPITLRFQTWCLLASDPNPVLERQPGNILRVKVDGAGCVGYPPRQDAPLVVDAGRLEPGVYFVELADYQSHPFEYFYRTAIEVAEGPGILRDGRFDLAVTWRTAAGGTGIGRLAEAPTRDSALFYFFSPENWELMVKVLDGCSINGHFWVFAAASTDVEYDVVVTDLLTSRTFTFGNRTGEAAVAVTEVNAFSCD